MIIINNLLNVIDFIYASYINCIIGNIKHIYNIIKWVVSTLYIML